ncbi:hypothetical protein [Sphingopyxis sp. PET50]|uniref:hypothetical protein n=1 Tax=Sphingopyxis sp. PET50 TaxID=2976533 RepID=UPI0021B0336E|nr:hypothetical protein [Sphingopyxis sp. PET50]
MKRSLPFITLLFLAVAADASAPRYGEDYPCYWVHGRLTAANGNPLWRIWPSGTKRILGIVGDHRGEDADFASWPLALRRANPGFNRIIWGQFQVCPVTAERVGWMRFVHLKDAKVLKIKTRGS